MPRRLARRHRPSFLDELDEAVDRVELELHTPNMEANVRSPVKSIVARRA
jgi:hypothetical protein